MKLTEEQTKKALALLNDYKQNRRACSICGNNEWYISDTLFELREFTGEYLQVGGEISLIPLLTVTCKKCGHIRLINAIKLGVISRQKDKEDKEDKEK